MARGSRRFHSKSRNGCGQCKKRRVRCSCEGPVCSNCRRRNEPCDFEIRNSSTRPSPPRPSNAAPFKTDHEDHETRTAVSVQGGLDRLSWADLFLVLRRHDALSPASSRYNPTAHVQLCFLQATWASPDLSHLHLADHQQIQKWEYLLPCLSSLSAIHLLSQGEPWSSEIYRQALGHNIIASAIFRHAERDIDEQNWISVLLFGVGNIMFNFAAAQVVPNNEFDYLGVFQVLRASNITGDIGRFLEKSQLGKLLHVRHGVMKPPINNDSLRALERLESVGHPEGTSRLARAACDHALEVLKRWVQTVRGFPQHWKHFIAWPTSVTDRFVFELRGKQPVALLIYIYWCVIMHKSPKRWYAESWHRRVASAAIVDVGLGYEDLLEWPREVLDSPRIADPWSPMGFREQAMLLHQLSIYEPNMMNNAHCTSTLE